MKTEQLAFFQYQSLAADMLVKATEFQFMKDDRMTTIYTVTTIQNQQVVRTQPGTRGEAIRQAEETIALFLRELNEVYNPPGAVVINRDEPEQGHYVIDFRKLSDGRQYSLACNDRIAAIDVWEGLNYLRNHYVMVSPRPR